MKILKKLMLVACAGVLLAACSKDLETIDPVVDPNEGWIEPIDAPKMTMSLGLAASDMNAPAQPIQLSDARSASFAEEEEDADEAISFGLQPATRATEAATPDEQTLVSVTVLQFDEETDAAKLVVCENYTKAGGQIADDNSVSVPLYELPKTTIYVIANVNYTALNSAINALTDKTLGNFKTMGIPMAEVKSTELTSKGLPMIGVCTSANITGDSAKITLSFLVAKIKMQLAVAMQKGTFTASAAELRDVPKSVPVAAPATTAGVANYTAFVKETCTNTSEITWYVPENLKGNITTITDAKKKSWWTAPSLASHIVISGTYTTQATPAKTYKVEYSIFPGSNDKTNFEIKRNTIYTINPTIKGINEKDLRVAYVGDETTTHDPNLCKDLVNGTAATANCYMVSKPLATYKFDARVMGNGNTAIIKYDYTPTTGAQQHAPALDGTKIKALAPKSVKTLWETNTNTPGAIIRAVKLVDGFVYFTTGSDLEKGTAEANALIAVYSTDAVPSNPETNVLWSWHIWSTAWGHATHTYTGKSSRSLKVMQRNLGAAHNNLATDTDNGSFGLLYQWGRKDPFVGAATASSDSNGDASNLGKFATSTKGNDWKTGKGSVANNPELVIQEAIQKPTTFFIQQDGTTYDWVGGGSYTYQRDNLWGAPRTETAAPTPSTCNASSLARSAKSPYDPCPAGYMVAPQDTWLNFTKKSSSTDSFVPGSNTSNSAQFNVYEGFKKGWNFYYSPSNYVYYPAAGYRYRETGALTVVGANGYAWSSSSNYAGNVNAGYLLFNSTSVGPLNWACRAHGFPVRCVQNQ